MAFDDELKFEKALVDLLRTECGWEKEIIKYPTEEDLIKNWANILFENNKEKYILNNCPLTESEMYQIITQVSALKNPVALNKFINGKTVSIVRDNKDDEINYGKSVSLKIYDRLEIAGGKSKYQIVEQPKFTTNNSIYPTRRGDLLLLINGMPLFHIELKKSGIPISQATTQIEKYMKNGVFTGIFSLIQVFVAMNPEESVYFANPGIDGVFKPEFFFHWEDFNNVVVNEWQKFTKKVLSIPMAHEIVGFYTVADNTDGVLKVLRSYQFEAASRIADKVATSHWTKAEQNGGYIWHTTGSGKTMTSFKAAQLIANSGDADKVVFLLDRIELGDQSFRDYKNFADPTMEIQDTENTEQLINKLKSNNVDDTLIVTSIQKMSRIKEKESSKAHDIEVIRKKHIVFIVDECHRSQMGKMHQDIKDLFPNAMYFGFTGTPEIKEIGDIAEDNIYTSDIFGDEIHRYTLYHGIRDKNVLKFDPIMVNTFDEKELRVTIALEKCHKKTIEEALKDNNSKETFLYYMNHGNKKCPMTEIERELSNAQYQTEEHENAVVKNIIDNWIIRSVDSKFHALLATSSIPEAISYYKIFKKYDSNLKITAVFDPSDDNSDISIEKIDGITEILKDYNKMFKKEYNIGQYASFKKDVCLRLAHKKQYISIENKPEEQINIVIVVDQLLTGFDSKWINTLYMDKEQERKNLIQSISRTNRLYGPEKPHGTVIFYRRPYTMIEKLHYAVELYAGEEEFGIYVNKLDKNLLKINYFFNEIKGLFLSASIYEFEKNADDVIWKRKFAKLFMEMNHFIDSAKIQGFRWNILKYDFYDENAEKYSVNLEFDEKIYLILVQRYKELFMKKGKNDPDLPYDISTHIIEIQTDAIDDEYMNSRFNIYLRSLNDGDEKAKEKALNELHKTFAVLNSIEQRYAKIFLHQVESGEIIVDNSKSFHEYITELHVKYNNDYIHKISNGFGVNEEKFRKLILAGATDKNINVYGRYDDLMDSIDINKAKEYLDERDKKEYTLREVRMKVDEELTQIILNGGVDELTDNIISQELN